MTEPQNAVNEEKIAEIVIACPNCKTEKSFKIDLDSEAWLMLCNHGRHTCKKCKTQYKIEGNIDYEKSIFPVNN
ncbi:MAG: hypothetical protein GWO87_03205 [Xanthomonadaceae bacterium]|nr:hypothetical protein [Rhodospirillaceae bacterium]NIA18169.1 hypothetical protein [Xanthomonadaceae bacterium]